MEKLLEMLYNKYNKITMCKTELAHELGMSTSSIDRRIKEGDFPQAIKVGGAKNASIRFNIIDVANYLTVNNGDSHET